MGLENPSYQDDDIEDFELEVKMFLKGWKSNDQRAHLLLLWSGFQSTRRLHFSIQFGENKRPGYSPFKKSHFKGQSLGKLEVVSVEVSH